MCQDTIQKDYTGKPLDASLFPDILGILPSWVSGKPIGEGSKDIHYESALKWPNLDKREKELVYVRLVSKLPLNINWAILETQLNLARQLNRAVSTHCVQNQGYLLSLLHKTCKKKAINLLDSSLVKIAHKLGTVKGWTIEKVVQQTHSNWTEFVTNPPLPHLYRSNNIIQCL
ncbi:hypothetical protein CLU79DRAFT_775813 [Phycomyces nitens]|nr:hypothetical protein CLU79DRAFT_775813 [Phycomyces nitens]